ncbi:hypothetical protein BC830DRAFT_112826 [Chytriomyces sp. MP71]|nr:hypothetical protein BC830DRAFT_112826 [Chytriomyces sp. MP71]
MACNALPVFDPKGVHAVPISLVSRLKKPPQLNVRTRLLRNGSGSASVNSISNGPASAPPFVAVGRRKGSTSSIQSISASSSNESNGSGSLSVEATVPKAAGVGSRRSTRSYAAASSSIHSAEKRTEDMLSIDQFNGPTQHAFQSSFLVPGMKRKRGRPLKSASSSNDSTRTASPTSEFSRSNRQEHRLSSRSSLGRAMIDAETSKKTNSSEPHLAASVIAKLSSHTMDKQSPRKGFKYHTNFLATSTASPLSLLAEAAAASSQQPTNPTQNLLSASPNRFSPKANFDPTKISIQIPISKSPAKPPPCPRLPSPAHPDDPPLAPMHAQSMTYILKRMRCHVAAAPFLETARAPLAFHLGAMLERLNGGGYESALAFRRDFDGMVGLLRDRVAARKGGAVGVEAKEVDFDASCVLKLETYFGNEWAHFFPEFLARRRKGPVAGSDERGVKKARK